MDGRSWQFTPTDSITWSNLRITQLACATLLADGGYTVSGKEGRHVRQIKVRGFGSAEKPYFVCVRLDRLPEQENCK